MNTFPTCGWPYMVMTGEKERHCVSSQTGWDSNRSWIFLPATPKIHDEIASARAFVLSSDYEGMPNVLIEAMALGLPAISTRVSGAVDLIDDGRNGFLVDCGDRNALADAMLKILSSAELQETVGEEATSIAQRLNIDTIYRQWMDMIDSVFENERTHE